MNARAQPETLHALFEDLPRLGDRPAIGLRLEYGLRWWSYAELHRRAQVAARLLEAAGVGRGDRVLFWGPSSPEWVGFFFGVLLRGAVVVPVDDGAPPETVRRMVEEVQARHLITVAGRAAPLPLSCLTFEALSLPAPGDAAGVQGIAAEPDEPAVIFFTSGTTSAPRGVVLTHRNLMSQVQRFSKWRWLVRLLSFRMMVSAPLSHVQGLMLGICIPLHVGLSAIYTHFSHPGHLIRTLRDDRVTLLSTVPRVLQVLARTFEARPYGRSGAPLREWLRHTTSRFLRRHRVFNTIRPAVGYRFWVVIVGGATLPRDIESFWRNTGCLLVQGYGLTETAAMISVNVPLFGTFGSIGKPLANQEVRIAEDGEILVRGPNIMAGYYGGRTDADLFTEGGYLRTGDLGRFDKRRRLFFEGRKKDVIVIGEGFNVYCEDVERVLDVQPGVRQSVAIGLEREGNTEVHAVLMLERGAAPAAIVQEANARLAPHERIRGWTLWPEEDFPRASLFKVQRKLVADAVERLRAASASPATASGPVSLEVIAGTQDRVQRLRLLARYLAEAPPEELANQRVQLVDDLGLSSLDVAELLFLLEARSQRVLSDVVVEENTSLADLHTLLSQPEGSRAVRALYARHPPRWAELGLLSLVRRTLNPLVLLPWVALRARLDVQGGEHLRAVKGPCVLATTGHEHASDVLTIFAALPARLRHKLGFVASRWVFSHYLEPSREATLLERLAVGVAFNAAIPLFFPFALTPHFGNTREGLLEACRLIDRGYSLIIFGGEGTRLIAKQTGVPIVPVQLTGNEGIGFLPRWPRRKLGVAFSAPLLLPSHGSDEALEG